MPRAVRKNSSPVSRKAIPSHARNLSAELLEAPIELPQPQRKPRTKKDASTTSEPSRHDLLHYCRVCGKKFNASTEADEQSAHAQALEHQAISGHIFADKKLAFTCTRNCSSAEQGDEGIAGVMMYGNVQRTWTPKQRKTALKKLNELFPE